jgi:long-chain acyl-CoA synthetase
VNPTDQEIRELVAGQTVGSEFLATVERLGDRRALRWMDGEDSWAEMSFVELRDQVARVAGGLRSIGVQPGDRVVIMMRNIPEFHVADLAVVFCGATPISIYNSSSADQVAFLAGHAEAKVALVEDDGFLERFEKVRDQMPALRTIVRLRDGDLDGEGVLPWSAVSGSEPVDLAEAVSLSSPDSVATIIYTSGTTGNPKGVMLSHSNLCWTGEALMQSFGWDRERGAGERVISYLPMAHIAERMVSHYGMAFFGYEVTTCPEPGQIANYAREVRPQLLFGVPRVWEKVYHGLHAALAADPEKEEKFHEAVQVALEIEPKITWGTATEEERSTYEFLDAVAFSTVRDLLGLDQLELAVTGAAPMVPDMLRFFRAIGIPLSEVYGMSENSGPLTFAPYKPKPGTVGPPIPGCDIAIADDGEVLARGGHVFQGYLNDPEKTAEALESDGWLHTGDIGTLDEDGYLRIVDRKKELIITAGGKNVSPANLEAALKTIPLVGQAAAIGDRRPFVSALVVLDPDEAPLWAAQNDLAHLSLAELAEHPAVIEEIERALPDAMAEFNNAERVKKVKVLGEEWMPDSDVLTPTSKLKRRGVNERYAHHIEQLYS